MMGRLTLALISQPHQSWLYASHRVGFNQFVLTVFEIVFGAYLCVCVRNMHSSTLLSDKIVHVKSGFRAHF